MIPPPIPECVLFSDTVAFISKVMHPLRLDVIVIVSSVYATESRHITRVGLSNKCLYFYK